MSTRMTCEQFEDAMMDELYGELDAAGSDALAEHAAACESCAAKISKLRSTRNALGALVVTPPEDMESRILAAAAAAEAAMSMPPAMPSNVVALPFAQHGREMAPPPGQKPPQEGSAKVFAFLSKPQLAAAAVVILVLGAAAFTTMSVSMKRSSPMAASEADNAPAAVAASAAQAPMGAPAPAATATTIVAQEESSPMASAAAPSFATPPPAAAPAPAPTMAGGALAFNSDPNADGPAMKKARPATKTVHAPPPAQPAPAAAAKAPADSKEGGSFESAKKLADAGRCAEALPTLEALAPSDPRADLLAARCVRNTRGCAAATARFDEVATRNSGNATGATATREKQQCQAALDHAEAKPGAGTPSTHAKPAKPAVEASPPATSRK